MPVLFLPNPAVLRGEEVASKANRVTDGHSPMMSLPPEMILNIVSYFTMAQFLRFRGVCQHYHQVVAKYERKIVCDLLKTPEFWLAGRLFGNTGHEMENYKHLFGLKRRCSVADTLAKFLSEYSFNEYGEDEQFVETEIRSHLLVLSHYLEHHRSCLKTFVSDANNEPRLGLPNEDIEGLTLAKYNHEAAYLLCGLHSWLMCLLEKRLEGEAITILDRADSPVAKYAELLVLGGIEAIRDSILPETPTERCNKMETHMQRACSVSPVGHKRLTELPAKTAGLALVLEPITPPLSLETAINMCSILPQDYDILEMLFVRLPEDPNELWQVDTGHAAHDFALEASSDRIPRFSERSPTDDRDSKEWLNMMVRSGFITLARVQ